MIQYDQAANVLTEIESLEFEVRGMELNNSHSQHNLKPKTSNVKR